MLAYLRHIADSCELNEFKRLMRLGRRGIGRIGLGEAFATAVFAQTGVTLSGAVERVGHELRGQRHTRESALELAGILRRLETAGREGGWSALVEATTAYLSGAATAEEESAKRTGVFGTAVSTAAENDDEAETPSAGPEDKTAAFVSLGAIAQRFGDYRSLAAFAASCADGTVPEGNEATIPGRVILSSCHRMKSREAKTVIVMATRGVFPHAKSEGNTAAMAEEERLWYVAATRARDVLAASYAERRGRGLGGPSPFLEGLWARTPQTATIDETMRQIRAAWEAEKVARKEATWSSEREMAQALREQRDAY